MNVHTTGVSARPVTDLTVVRNLLIGAVMILFMLAPFFGRYWLAVAAPGIAALIWPERNRSLRRHDARRRLEGWSDEPVKWEAPFVVQSTADRQVSGMIDTRDHYTVSWERFDAKRALYRITQGSAQVFISTLAPNAEDVLVKALRVANYPCMEWPNWDL